MGGVVFTIIMYFLERLTSMPNKVTLLSVHDTSTKPFSISEKLVLEHPYDMISPFPSFMSSIVKNRSYLYPLKPIYMSVLQLIRLIMNSYRFCFSPELSLSKHIKFDSSGGSSY